MRSSALAGVLFACTGCSYVLPFDDDFSDGKTTHDEPCAFSFEAETRFPTAGYTQDVAIADFDDDSQLDLVVAMFDPDADATGPEILLGNGKGEFESWHQLSKFTLIARSVATADINGDKRADIAVSYQNVDPSESAGSFDTELGDGTGDLDSGQIFTVPQAGDIALGDFNGDGRNDAAVIATESVDQVADEKLYVFMNQSDGSLGMPTIYDKNELDNTMNAITAGDVNLDGRMDLAVSHWGSSSIHVMLGAADGPSYPRAVEPAAYARHAVATSARRVPDIAA